MISSYSSISPFLTGLLRLQVLSGDELLWGPSTPVWPDKSDPLLHFRRGLAKLDTAVRKMLEGCEDEKVHRLVQEVVKVIREMMAFDPEVRLALDPEARLTYAAAADRLDEIWKESRVITTGRNRGNLIPASLPDFVLRSVRRGRAVP